MWTSSISMRQTTTHPLRRPWGPANSCTLVSSSGGKEGRRGREKEGGRREGERGIEREREREGGRERRGEGGRG